MHRLRYVIGLLTLVAAVVAAIQVVKVLRQLDERPGLKLQVEFREARGLRSGANVRYRGVNVGVVRSIGISQDGSKAVVQLLLDPPGVAQACVNSSFWIVTPRFSGLDGASGLDTLVRDSYVAFQTPAERGSPLVDGSLLSGKERPPLSEEVESLEDIDHGDLLMTLLVPENHGLKPGSAVIFRGMKTGDVRRVGLAASGTHVEVTLRIARAHRQTVTDKTSFWVARPYVSGALFSGFTVTDVTSLLTPFVSYYGEPGKGVLVQDGYRAAALAARPSIEAAAVPAEALRQVPRVAVPKGDDLVLVRIAYAAIERDTWSADDPIQRQGSGVLFLDRSGRAVVVTARSLVDASFTETDAFGGAPDIDGEQIKVLLGSGTVLRAGRVWVDPGGKDLAALVLEDAPPDLVGTPTARLHFAGAPPEGERTIRAAGPDGAPLPAIDAARATGSDVHGGATTVGDRVVGIVALPTEGAAPTIVALELLPADLRPQ
ncbi:MAG: MCE family protein [Planctomycetes bacterium]|nr:MCE family protein [Planctomycetota bacterium]